jgi:hypothetical protein
MRLRDRHRYTGDAADLLAGIERLRAAIGYVGPHPIRYSLVANLSSLLLDHFTTFGDVAALHESMAGCDEVLPSLDDENRVAVAMMRAEASSLLAERTRDAGRTDAAVDAAAALPPSPAARFVQGRALLVRYQVTGDRRSLADSAVALEDSVRETPVDDPHYPLRLNRLGDVLLTTAEDTGDETARETAIRHLRTAVAHPSNGPDGALWPTINLAAALRLRGRQTGDVAALRESVALLGEVLAATPPDTHPWGNRCENYLVAVQELAERTGDVELLDQAVEIGRSARARAARPPRSRCCWGCCTTNGSGSPGASTT